MTGDSVIVIVVCTAYAYSLMVPLFFSKRFGNEWFLRWPLWLKLVAVAISPVTAAIFWLVTLFWHLPYMIWKDSKDRKQMGSPEFATQLVR